MNRNLKNLFYYVIMIALGIILLILGVILRSSVELSGKMFKGGFAMLGVGLIFLLITLKVQSSEKNDKTLQRINDAAFDERNQFIAAKASHIALDMVVTCSLLAFLILSFLGMTSYANATLVYTIVISILRLSISIYLRRKY